MSRRMAERDGVMDVAKWGTGKLRCPGVNLSYIRPLVGMSFANELHRTSHGEAEELKLLKVD